MKSVTSPEQRSEIISLYKEGLSVKNLSLLFNKSKEVTRIILRKAEIDLTPNMYSAGRKYNINHSYFSKIDKEYYDKIEEIAKLDYAGT